MRVLFIICVLSALKSAGQKVNFADDVACIIYSHCTPCHSTNLAVGGIVLNNYHDAWSQRNVIKIYTQNKYMPPYMPSVEKTHYAVQKNLSEEELEILKQWVETGCDSGDLSSAPPPPVITNPISELSSPDISVRIPNYTATSQGEIYRQCFVLTAPTTQVNYIDAIEIVPSDISAVYAYYVFADTSSLLLSLDAVDTAIGYTNYGATGSVSSRQVYGWMNGSPVQYFPFWCPLKIDSGSRFIVQVEYAENAGGKMDSTQLNIRWATSPPGRFLNSQMLLSDEQNLLNPPLLIPADSVVDFYESTFISNDLTLYSITPLSHHLCIAMEVYAISAAQDTIYLFESDDCASIWSQGFYIFDQPKYIPAGSTLYAHGVFDNTLDNEHNPFDPPQDILAGYGDDEEQLVFYFQTTSYAFGDELRVIDSTQHLTHYQNCQSLHNLTGIYSSKEINEWNFYPNPSGDYLRMETRNELPYSFEIMNMTGEILISGINKTGPCAVSVSEIPSGVYAIRFCSPNGGITRKIIIQH